MESFESAKSEIVGSALGSALSMSTSSTWSDVVTKIKGVSNQGAKTSNLNCGGSYTIPAGYHNGSGKITANSLSSQTSGTASASDILSGKTAWVSGSKRTGTMTNRGNLNWSGSNTTYSVPAGYYSGGTLNSKTSYTNGYRQGIADGRPNQNAYVVAYGSGQYLSFTSDGSSMYVACMAGTAGSSKYNNFAQSGVTNPIATLKWDGGSQFCRMYIFAVNAANKQVTINWGAGTNGGLVVKTSAY